MNKGFTLIEAVMTVIVIAILGAFTFSVIWEYSSIYATTRKGFIYGEAAAVMERITRELRDAQAVDWDVAGGLVHNYLTFQLTHGTPANPNPYWVQYCIAGVATPAGITRAKLWRVEFNNNTPPYADQCISGNPIKGGGGGTIATVALMSGNVMSAHFAGSSTVMGLQVMAYWSGQGIDDNYEIKLALTADRTQLNLQDGAQYGSNPSITLVSRVAPKNYMAWNGSTGIGQRSFGSGYYDESK